MAISLKRGKVEENKEEKENKLLESAFSLFTEKGVKRTSVQEIARQAGVAKGTFYLYFKDKYDVQDYLIAKKSKQLLTDAINSLKDKDITNYSEKIICIMDYIINEFIDNKLLLKFISKNLSWGVYTDKIKLIMDDSSIGILDLFEKDIINNIQFNITNEYKKMCIENWKTTNMHCDYFKKCYIFLIFAFISLAVNFVFILYL